jgi:hypothetical protein
MLPATFANRVKSSALMAVGFLVLLYAVATVLALIPVVGRLTSAAIFGSPFVLLLMALKGPGGPNAVLLGLAITAPYPLIGGLIGYYWPVDTSTKLVALRQIALRFALTFFVLVAIGFCVAFYAASVDS